MPKRELEKLLGELARELEQDDALDPEEIEALAGLQTRIGRVLAAEETPPGGDEQGITEPLAEYIDRFESTHPTLTMTLGRIMDALNKLGI
ncbi:MAG: DUF4404 family protein [Gammaproteobacteria bacterium]